MNDPSIRFTIRSATPSDEEAVVELWKACALTTPYNEPNLDFRFASQKPGSDVLVAVDDAERIVGSVLVGHDGHRGWIYYVAAAPDTRQQGVGRAIVEAAEAWLRGEGVAKVQLMIRETNIAVRDFYEKLGYEHTPRTVMAKWL